MVHVAAPDIVAHRAVTWARKRKIPVVSSVHTRFDTYLQYYGLKFLEPVARAIMRRYYRRCDAIVVPAESTAAIMRAQRMNKDISIWARGVDREQFNPERRSLEWRRAHGIGDEEMVVAFLGRLVLEKGLDVFADAIDAARAKGVPLRVVAIGDGPARDYFQQRLPDAIFTGQLTGAELATALASTDVFLNPSITETFGNVTLEAMACGLPVMRRRRVGRDQPGQGRRDRPAGGARRHRGVRRRARRLSARSRPAREAWRRPGWNSPRRWTGTRSTPP